MKDQQLRIETERLILRPFTMEDVAPSYEMNLDAEVSKYTGDGGVVSKKEIERRIRENVLGDYQKHGYGRLAVILKKENKFIGFSGLKYLEDRKETDLGYRFMRSYWHNGIATEAAIACLDMGFNSFNLSKIIAMVLPENKASIRVLNKLNFKYDREIIEDGLKAQLHTLMRNDYFNS